MRLRPTFRVQPYVHSPYSFIISILSYHVRFDTTAAMTMEIIFWNATPCGLFDTYQCYSKISVIIYETKRRHAPN